MEEIEIEGCIYEIIENPWGDYAVLLESEMIAQSIPYEEIKDFICAHHGKIKKGGRHARF